jgi:hypothetical protein
MALARKLEGISAANRSLGRVTKEDSKNERCGQKEDQCEADANWRKKRAGIAV